MKSLKLKRLLSAALAGAMSLTLATTAFAAGNETVITATVKETEIAVTVPGTVDAFINPYGVDVNYDENDPARILKGFQILSVPNCIYNLSGMDLSVSATVTGEIVARADETDTTKAMKFSTTSTDGATVTTKNAYVTFQMKVDNAIAGTVDDITPTMIGTQAEKWAVDADADGEVVVKVGDTAGVDLVALKKADLTDAQNPKAVAGGAALIRLNGDCVTAPKIAWDEKDSFKVTVAYTFMPTTIA